MSFRSIGLHAIVAGAVCFTTAATARAETPGCTAAGSINPAFPSRLLIGVASGSPDDTWPQQSGTKWDVQWVYLSGQAGNNWYNGYGGSPADGSWIDGFFSSINAHGFIPGIHLYNMGFGHAGGDSGILSEVQTASWTREYFTEFKALMTHAKSFGKPVMIMLEGDSFGYLEMQANNDPTVMAAVASTGMPELAGLPNTLAGFGMAFLAIRKSVGAYNVALGPDTPYYAANGDIMNFSPSDTDSLQPHVDFQWKFFGSFVGPNMTGDRFDFTASCPDANDCAAYTDGRPCWNPSDTASVDSASVNRYVQWLQLFNQTSGVRWILHQVPIGNSQNRNVPWDGTAKSGYQDNKTEYLFQYESPASTAIRDQHLANFANAGVVAMWFGSSDDGATPATDVWKDNQPFLKTHVAVVNNTGGGFTIASANAVVCGGDGGTGSAGPGSSSSGGATSSTGGSSSGSAGAVDAGHGSSSGGSGPGSSSGSSGTSSSGAGGTSSGGGNGGSGGYGGTVDAGGAGQDDGGAGSGDTTGGDWSSKTSGGCGVLGSAPPGGASLAGLALLASALLLRRRRS